MNPMTSLALLASLVGSAELPGRLATERAVCPSGSDWHQRIAARFVSGPDFESFRQETGLAAVRAGDLRVLADARDATACERLNAIVSAGGAIGPGEGGWWAFYTVGGSYIIVSATAPGTGGLALGADYLAVLDPSFSVRDAFMM